MRHKTCPFCSSRKHLPQDCLMQSYRQLTPQLQPSSQLFLVGSMVTYLISTHQLSTVAQELGGTPYLNNEGNLVRMNISNSTIDFNTNITKRALAKMSFSTRFVVNTRHVEPSPFLEGGKTGLVNYYNEKLLDVQKQDQTPNSGKIIAEWAFERISYPGKGPYWQRQAEAFCKLVDRELISKYN